MTEIEALRAEVANLRTAQKRILASLNEAEAQLRAAEFEVDKDASVAIRSDAVNIGGQWVANLSRMGPRTVTGWVLLCGDYGWRWYVRGTLLPYMKTAEDRAALLAAAGEWRK